MPRMLVDDLHLLIAANLPDNNTQEIAPADVRAVLSSMVDSMVPAAAAVYGSSGAGVPFSLTTTPQKLPASIYTTAFNAKSTLLEGRVATGDLKANTAIGRLFAIIGVTMIAPSGSDIVFTLARNGVLIPAAPVLTGRGTGNPVTAEFGWIVPELALNDVFDIWSYGLTASANISLRGMFLQGILMPQFHL